MNEDQKPLTAKSPLERVKERLEDLQNSMPRGTGITSKQMTDAPILAVYVWCNGHLWYPQLLAKRLKREDLEIVSPDWILNGRWQNRNLTGIVVDHALGTWFRYPRRFEDLLRIALSNVR